MVCIDKNAVSRQTSQLRSYPFNMSAFERLLGITMSPFIVRGVLIGGSLGVFAALFGVVDNMPRAFVIGIIAGALAGLTMARLRKNKPPMD